MAHVQGLGLRACLTCGDLKPGCWFDLEDATCNTCSRMSDRWATDEADYAPVIRNVLPAIDWAPVQCPLCGCRLFAEEVRLFHHSTGAEGRFPCCCNGVADIRISFPNNLADKVNGFTPNQWSEANRVCSAVATLPSTIARREVTGLPSQVTHYTDLMRDGHTGLKLLWSLKAGTTVPRRQVLREFGHAFPLSFVFPTEVEVDAALGRGVYMMADVDGLPRIAGVLDPLNPRHVGAYAGLPAAYGASRDLAAQCNNATARAAVDILGFPALFISYASRADRIDGSELTEFDFYSNCAWRVTDLWGYYNLLETAGMFLIRGWVSAESERLAKAIQLKAAIENRARCKIPGLPESFLGSVAHISALRADTFECIRRLGPPTIFITYTMNTNDEAFIFFGFDATTWDPKDAYTFAPLTNRIFKVRWSHFLQDCDDGSLFGPLLWRASGIEFQRGGLIHGHVLLCLRERFRSRRHLESQISANTSASPFRDFYRTAHTHDCSKGFCTKVGGRCSKFFPYVAPSPTHWMAKNGMAFCQYARATGDRFTVPFSELLTQYFGSSHQDAPRRTMAHVNPLCVDGVNVIKYLFKYPIKPFLRTAEGKLLQWEAQHREGDIYKSKRIVSLGAASFDLLNFSRYEVRCAGVPSNGVPGRLLKVKEVPADWLENRQEGGRPANKLLAYLHRPPALQCYAFLDFLQLYRVSRHSVSASREPVGTVDVFGCGCVSYFRNLDHEEFVWRFPRFSSKSEETFWRKLILESGPVSAAELSPTWAQSAGLFLQEALYELGSQILHRSSNALLGYVDHLLRTLESTQEVVKYIRMLEGYFSRDELTAPTFFRVLRELTGAEVHALPQQDATPLRPLVMTPKLAEAADIVLNHDQEDALRLARESFAVGSGVCLIRGRAGTGKTVLAWRVLYEAVNQGAEATACAASWEAARLLPNVASFHELFGLRPGKPPVVSPARVEFLQRLQVVWIDEVYLLKRGDLMEAEAVAREARQNQAPWGGLVVFFGGCDAQIAAVIAQNDHEDELRFLSPEEVQATHSAASYFKDLAGTTPVRAKVLTINERYRDDVEWGMALNQIGDSSVVSIPLDLFPRIPLHDIPPEVVASKDEAVACPTHVLCLRVAKETVGRYAAQHGKTAHAEHAANECIDEPLLTHCITGRDCSDLPYSVLHWCPGVLGTTMMAIGEHPPKSQFAFLRKDGDVIWIRFVESGELFPLCRVKMEAEIDGLQFCRFLCGRKFSALHRTDQAGGLLRASRGLHCSRLYSVGTGLPDGRPLSKRWLLCLRAIFGDLVSPKVALWHRLGRRLGQTEWRLCLRAIFRDAVSPKLAFWRRSLSKESPLCLTATFRDRGPEKWPSGAGLCPKHGATFRGHVSRKVTVWRRPVCRLEQSVGIPPRLSLIHQYPVRLAQIATADALQGRTLARLFVAGVPFGHGRLYVTLSRCTTRGGIHILDDVEDEAFLNEQNPACFLTLPVE